MFIVVYLVLGYWAYGVMNSGKVYIYKGFGGLFLHKLIMGFLLGWLFIPLAVLKKLFKRSE